MTLIFLASGASWTVPADWNNLSNTIECIGASGLGGPNARGGGGGGAYSKISNLSLTPGSSITIQVGAAGSDYTDNLQPITRNTYFNGANLAASSVGAQGGKNPNITTGGTGGASGSGIGTTKHSGGNGGNASGNVGGGGGGAAGPNGAGANGSGQTGGAGGNGSGGAGGAAGANAGGNGTEFDATHGSGGGGGGGNNGAAGGAGGNYGAANGGSGLGISGVPGTDGLIVINYVPLANFLLMF